MIDKNAKKEYDIFYHFVQSSLQLLYFLPFMSPFMKIDKCLGEDIII